MIPSSKLRVVHIQGTSFLPGLFLHCPHLAGVVQNLIMPEGKASVAMSRPSCFFIWLAVEDVRVYDHPNITYQVSCLHSVYIKDKRPLPFPRFLGSSTLPHLLTSTQFDVLRLVRERVRYTRLYEKPSKCTFYRYDIEFLRFSIDHERVISNPEVVGVFQDGQY